MNTERADPGSRLHALLDAMLQAWLDAFPETATRLGLDGGAHASRRARLNASSVAAITGHLQDQRRFLEALKQIDSGTLGEMARIDRDAVLFHTDAVLEGARLMPHGHPQEFQPYVVTQLSGAYQSLPDLLCTKHPLETVADAEAYLARLEAFRIALRDEVARARFDAASGVSPPSFVIDTAIAQLRNLAETPAEKWPIVASLVQRTHAHDIAGAWQRDACRIVEEKLRPAVGQLIAALHQLRVIASDDAGVWKLPDGDAYYRAAIIAQTTKQLGADEIHRLGLEQVAELLAQTERLLQTLDMRAGTVAERLRALTLDERYVYPNDEQGRDRLLEELRALVTEVQGRLPEMFARLPRAALEVRRVPTAIEAGAPRGYYTPGPADGSRPGAFYVNLRDTRDWARWYAPTFAHHEGAPGHHLQTALALETGEISMLRRALPFTAYGEGWALYAEQLADEMGLYEREPIGRVGYLQSMLLRAARLVVDTGLHAKRWTRQQAIGYLVMTVGETPGRAAAEVDRYCVMPAQALGYKLGHLHWQQVRRAAQLALGAQFDMRRFHSEMLRRGPMPLAMLDQTIVTG